MACAAWAFPALFSPRRDGSAWALSERPGMCSVSGASRWCVMLHHGGATIPAGHSMPAADVEEEALKGK